MSRMPSGDALGRQGVERRLGAGVGASGPALSKKVVFEPATAEAKLHDLVGFAKAMLAGGSAAVAAACKFPGGLSGMRGA